MLFAEVLLPLPLTGTFTYAIPDSMPEPARGVRVMVQFGPRKYYTGIITEIHRNPPEGYEPKEIMAVIDERPALRYPQLRFWNWMAEYYLCTPGEVMRAALPSGMKISSETYVTVVPDFIEEMYETSRNRAGLAQAQLDVLDVISDGSSVRLSDLERITGNPHAGNAVNALLRAGAVNVSEKAVERYKPRKETFVKICCERDNQEKLHEYFDLVHRSRSQEKLLVAYLDMSRWLRHDCAEAEVSKAALLEKAKVSPAVFRALVDKKIFSVYKRIVNRLASPSDTPRQAPPVLSHAQEAALREINSSFSGHDVTLLHGVTGSGKTEVYSHFISSALDAGKSVLYLVPEISLTTQLTDRLRRVFGDTLFVYHSKFSDTERVEIWNRMLLTRKPIVVLGVRSSVFLPFLNLGLVVVDEEHEASFKQYDPAPRYNGRDAAIMLAAMHGAKTLLGSATPSVETYWKARQGKYGLVTLSERFEGAVLPDVEIVDMRDQRKRKLASGSISAPLAAVTRDALEKGFQAIMFQNRRGFAPVIVCGQCGWTPKCQNCDVSPVYHKNTNDLQCHYCGAVAQLPTLCPACGQNSIDVFGYGTERIAEEMHKAFEPYRVARMDLDTTRSKDATQEIIEEFSRGETDILVGTQMVSKGLDFEKVKVVGVINADTLLNFPDFRSSERAFNMLEQVAGRAGRRQEKGKVVIQTTSPDNPVLSYVRNHDYNSFYENELEERQRYSYPPFTKVINIYLKHRDLRELDRLAVAYVLSLRRIFGDRVLGPEKPFVSRVANYHLQSVMLKIETGASMRKVKEILHGLRASLAADPSTRQLQLYYDVDPV